MITPIQTTHNNNEFNLLYNIPNYISNMIYEHSLYIDIWELLWYESSESYGWIKLVKKCKEIIQSQTNTFIKIENAKTNSKNIIVYTMGWYKQNICDAINYISSLYIIGVDFCRCGSGCGDSVWIQDDDSVALYT